MLKFSIIYLDNYQLLILFENSIIENSPARYCLAKHGRRVENWELKIENWEYNYTS